MCAKRIIGAWHYEFSASPGFIIPFLRFLFRVLAWLFPSQWIREFIKCEKIRYRCIDALEIFWVVVLILLLASHGWYFKSSLYLCLVISIVIYRLYDIFQSWVYQFILMEDWRPVNIYRSLVLVIIGYFEIIISYSVLYFILQDNISKSFYSVCQSLYYSVTTSTMIGSNDWQPVKPWGYVIFFSQIIFALLFLTVVVQHIIGRKDKQ